MGCFGGVQAVLRRWYAVWFLVVPVCVGAMRVINLCAGERTT
jgi:hypothetical protein